MTGLEVSARALNVVLRPDSKAHRRVKPTQPPPNGGQPSPNLASGFTPEPAWNLKYLGGPTSADLTFVNRYIGGAGAWSDSDMSSIDTALSAAFSDPGLESVMAQYFTGPITSKMLPSAVQEGAVPPTVYKDTAETMAQQAHSDGALGGADPAKSVICIMLPQGVVLSDDFSPGYQPPPAGTQAAERYARRKRGVIKVDKHDAADSKNGLGGYHGSVHVSGALEVFYAVGVYSEGSNGIDAFGVPWKNVVATFYHELNEARTDLAVEDVNSTGNDTLLGWYSQTGQGEIGDLPINGCNGQLGLVFREVPLVSGGTVPIQLMWSNAAAGPASSA